jgi:hypothetical protein
MSSAAYLFFTVCVICVFGIVALRMWIDYRLDMSDETEISGSNYSSTETREL